MCPRLNRPKEGLAGATLNNKIFAIGGGNGPETFSEVEMLDPALSRWIYSTPLLHRVHLIPCNCKFISSKFIHSW